MENLVIFAYPNTTILVEFETLLIQKYVLPNFNVTPHANEKSIDGKYIFSMQIGFRKCRAGEIYPNNSLRLSLKNKLLKFISCILCPNGKYSFFSNDTDCKPCSSGLSCTSNGLEILNGYWREKETDFNAIKCKKTEVCL